MKKFIIGIIVIFVLLYIGITFGFTNFSCSRNDIGCKCIMNSITKNMSFIDKIKFLMTGANREELITYLDLGDTIKCAIVTDTTTVPSLQYRQLDVWQNTTQEQKTTTIKIVTSQEKDIDLIIDCVDKMMVLPDSSSLLVHDAITLCFNGLKMNKK